jgi:hypothetical protein
MLNVTHRVQTLAAVTRLVTRQARSRLGDDDFYTRDIKSLDSPEIQ